MCIIVVNVIQNLMSLHLMQQTWSVKSPEMAVKLLSMEGSGGAVVIKLLLIGFRFSNIIASRVLYMCVCFLRGRGPSLQDIDCDGMLRSTGHAKVSCSLSSMSANIFINLGEA